MSASEKLEQAVEMIRQLSVGAADIKCRFNRAVNEVPGEAADAFVRYESEDRVTVTLEIIGAWSGRPSA